MMANESALDRRSVRSASGDDMAREAARRSEEAAASAGVAWDVGREFGPRGSRARRSLRGEFGMALRVAASRLAARPALGALAMARRGLAAGAEGLPLEPPVKMYGIAGRYANALYSAAAQNGELKAVAADLSLVSETMKASPEFKEYVGNPSVPRAVKAAGMVEILDAAKACETTKGTFVALAEAGRMGEVGKVMDMYDDLLKSASGDVKAVITSATPLSEKDLAQLTESVKSNFLDAGSSGNVSITTAIDPALVAGVTIEVGDRYMDLSAATQLKKLQSLLSTV